MTGSLPLVRSLLLTLVIAVGIATAWAVAVGWLLVVEESVVSRRQEYEQLYLGLDGQPIITRTSLASYSTSQSVTLTGEPTPVKPTDLLYPSYIGSRDRTNIFARPGWTMRISAANDGGVPPIYWYLVHDGQQHGRVYGIGYHSQTKQIAGYFGKQGFSSALPPREERFEAPGDYGLSGITTSYGDGREPYYTSDPILVLLADDKLWVIDLAQRNVKALLDCPSAYTVGNVWQLPQEILSPAERVAGQTAQTTTPTRVAVRQDDNLFVVDHRRGTSTSYPIPQKLRNISLAGAILPDKNLLLVSWDQERHAPVEAIWLDSQGKILKELPVRMQVQTLGADDRSGAWASAAMSPVPLVQGLIPVLASMTIVEAGDASPYTTRLLKLLDLMWPSIATVFALGAFAAAAAYRRQRRFNLPHAGAWAAFAFFLGIPGWLAYRLHRRWPVLEDCPACNQAAPRDREICTECGAAFPPPPLKGIEVFA